MSSIQSEGRYCNRPRFGRAPDLPRLFVFSAFASTPDPGHHSTVPALILLIPPPLPYITAHRTIYQQKKTESTISPISLGATRPEPEPKCPNPSPPADVAAHNNADKGLYIIIDNNVYDVTAFVDEHPGGAKILKRVAGKDASKQFWKVRLSPLLLPSRGRGIYGSYLDWVANVGNFLSIVSQ